MACCPTPARAEAVVREEIRLELDAALWKSNPEKAVPLLLVLLRENDRWAPVVWGRSYRYNHGDHLGAIVASADEGAETKLSIKLLIRGDKWTPGGQTAYELSIRRTGDSFAGQWKGQWKGQSCEGKISGTAEAVRPMPGFLPPAPGEHPRLLFRKRDLPALRAKAATPWGQEMLKRLDGTAGTALRYSLTGDAALLSAVQQAIEAACASRVANWKMPHSLPDAAVDLAFAYDLIHDGCDHQYRDRMRHRFEDLVPYLHTGANYVYGLFNPADVSNWGARFRAGAGLCAMSLLDADDPPPAAPRIHRLVPPAELKIGKGVSTIKHQPGNAWSGWLAAGPLPIGPAADALTAIGGEAAAAPEHGTTVALDPPAKVARTFAPVDPKHVLTPQWARTTHNEWMEGGVDLTSLSEKNYEQTIYLYAVLENDAAGHYRVDYSTWGLYKPRLFLAGRKLSVGDVVFLEKGRFPALFVAPLKRIKDGQQTPFAVRLTAATAAEAADWLREAVFAHEVESAARNYARQQRDRGIAAGFLSTCSLLPYRLRMENYSLYSLGENGWNTEGECYAQPTVRLIFPFAHAYRNLTGGEISSRPHLGMVLPLGVARTVFGAEGETAARMEGFGAGGGPLGVDLWPRGFSSVPAPLRGATLWAWNRTQALADAGRLKDPHDTVKDLDDLSAAMMFVNYPLDLPEENPAKRLPAVTVDRQRGGYVFRNRWRDGDDCVVSILANANLYDDGRYESSWAATDTGDFRIQGLGVDWAVRGTGFGHAKKINWRTLPNHRMYQNVVQLSEDTFDGVAPAGETHFAPRPDGSGVVSLNMDHVYSGKEPGPKGEVRLPPLGRRRKFDGYDLGIRGLRSLAVDFSGACGTPCLVAVADKIDGSAGNNRWEFCTPQEHAVTVESNGFVVKAANGATLKATIAAPAAAEIATKPMVLTHEIQCVPGRHANADFKRTIVAVPGGGFFFVVMTVQQGPAPEVKIDRSGPRPKAIVGKQTVSFDGEKIVFDVKR
ncbi:MAG: hypothetical protein ABR915_15430 [Thermoguttaceae bacterium]